MFDSSALRRVYSAIEAQVGVGELLQFDTRRQGFLKTKVLVHGEGLRGRDGRACASVVLQHALGYLGQRREVICRGSGSVHASAFTGLGLLIPTREK